VSAVSSSPIPAVLAKPGPLNSDDVADLRVFLEAVPDPRSGRGRWHSLASILLVCAAAAVSGARTIDELAEWGARADAGLLATLGVRRHPLRWRHAPSRSAIGRVLEPLAADALDAAVGAWLAQRHRAGTAAGEDRRRVIAMDGKALRGPARLDQPRRHLLSAVTPEPQERERRVLVAGHWLQLRAVAHERAGDARRGGERGRRSRLGVLAEERGERDRKLSGDGSQDVQGRNGLAVLDLRQVPLSDAAQACDRCLFPVPVLQPVVPNALTDRKSRYQAFVGPSTVEQAQHLRVRVRAFFLGATAIDTRGIYVEADIERPTKLALMDAADHVVLVVDATKFSRTSVVRLCGFERISTLVSDRQPPAPVAEKLAEHQVKVVVPGTD
jgi:hypothetical protein